MIKEWIITEDKISDVYFIGTMIGMTIFIGVLIYISL
jgi:hypothetical protein